jgi:hypothetical protein
VRQTSSAMHVQNGTWPRVILPKQYQGNISKQLQVKMKPTRFSRRAKSQVYIKILTRKRIASRPREQRKIVLDLFLPSGHQNYLHSKAYIFSIPKVEKENMAYTQLIKMMLFKIVNLAVTYIQDQVIFLLAEVIVC